MTSWSLHLGAIRRAIGGWAACLVVVAASCTSPPLSNGFPAGEIHCGSCHGNAENFAPPAAIADDPVAAAFAIGAHQVHVAGGSVRGPIDCAECHLVPEEIDDEGHIDPLPAEVIFGPIAKAGGLSPTWDRERAGCSATYCHGGDRPDAEHPAPIWTLTDGSQSTCTSCHGFPPAAPHPASTLCSRCHTDTVDAAGMIRVDLGLHVNGVVDVIDVECTGCHGSGGDPAPPFALDGSTDPSSRGVGAHRSHLRGADWRAPVNCDDCHLVPVEVGDMGHLGDDNVAELQFSTRSTVPGLLPSFDGVRCSNIACHGGARTDAEDAEPIWTRTDGSQTTCASCHGDPPSIKGHPPRTDCFTCHSDVLRADRSFVRPDLHIDGVVQAPELECATCHGQDGNPAPPQDLYGNTASSSRGVGAHALHLEASPRHGPLACTNCHRVPDNVNDEGHIGNQDNLAEVVFGALATSGGRNPSYDATALTCSNTYCHGDGSAGSSVWTAPQAQPDCASCHGMPPALEHPARADCATCHASVINDIRAIIEPSFHVDGQVQSVGTTCTSCHGEPGRAAPPRDTRGQTDATFVGVGAHEAHFGASNWHAEVTCDSCHQVPENNDDPGHYDSDLPAELVWGYAARRDGAEPSWDGVGCSNVYCHGGTLTQPGAIHPEPQWTVVDQTQSSCLSCHGFPPGGTHPQVTNCVLCHWRVYQGGLEFVAPERHINGVIDVY